MKRSFYFFSFLLALVLTGCNSPIKTAEQELTRQLKDSAGIELTSCALEAIDDTTFAGQVSYFCTQEQIDEMIAEAEASQDMMMYLMANFMQAVVGEELEYNVEFTFVDNELNFRQFEMTEECSVRVDSIMASALEGEEDMYDEESL